jgi:hypothetical protein
MNFIDEMSSKSALRLGSPFELGVGSQSALHYSYILNPYPEKAF